jgi:hypothetical protein
LAPHARPRTPPCTTWHQPRKQQGGCSNSDHSTPQQRQRTQLLRRRTADTLRNYRPQVLPKDALIAWPANTTADVAVDNWADLAQLPPSKRRAKLKAARSDDRGTAARRATRVHKLAEKLAHPDLDAHGQPIPVDVPD